MRALSLGLVVLFLSVLVAGCVENDPDGAPPATTDVLPTGAAGNQWLLGGPGPIQNTRVAGGSEPAILVDKDDQYIWVGDTEGVYRSADGGQSFQLRRPGMINLVLADGWDLAQDDAGTLYAVGLAEARLHVYRSLDKGTTWNAITDPYYLPDTVGAVPDRPWIDATGDGNIALVYNDSGRSTRCMISHDGGLTWLDQHPTAGAPIAGGVDWDGDTLYYMGGSGQIYRRITTSPTTQAGAPTQCLLGGGSWNAAVWGFGHNNQLQVAAEGGAVFTAFSNSANDIVLVGTNTFTGLPQPLVVSPPDLLTNTFATLDVHDGRVAIAWYGTETDGNPTTASFPGVWNVYVAVVDGYFTTNPTIQHFRLTDQPNHVGDICMAGIGCGGGQDRDLLDYFMLDIGPNGDIHVAYAHDGASSNADTYYARIAKP